MIWTNRIMEGESIRDVLAPEQEEVEDKIADGFWKLVQGDKDVQVKEGENPSGFSYKALYKDEEKGTVVALGEPKESAWGILGIEYKIKSDVLKSLLGVPTEIETILRVANDGKIWGEVLQNHLDGIAKQELGGLYNREESEIEWNDAEIKGEMVIIPVRVSASMDAKSYQLMQREIWQMDRE